MDRATARVGAARSSSDSRGGRRETVPGHGQHRGDPRDQPMGRALGRHHQPLARRQGGRRPGGRLEGDPGGGRGRHLARDHRARRRADVRGGTAARGHGAERGRQGPDDARRPRGRQAARGRRDPDQRDARLLAGAGDPGGRDRGVLRVAVPRTAGRRGRGRDEAAARHLRDLRGAGLHFERPGGLAPPPDARRGRRARGSGHRHDAVRRLHEAREASTDRFRAGAVPRRLANAPGGTPHPDTDQQP